MDRRDRNNYKKTNGIMRMLLIILLGTLIVSCGKKRSIHITATNVVTGERYPKRRGAGRIQRLGE